eukprot:NODE_6646_length_1652_cov_10.990820.p1 GENE.NODE_6646_length_1652_cov_10.990820~~NODE_6646_length_1652_cov_10.990820.p1  ORF type:complete len:494 (-),score=100.31 NODE_6646_length_1652_cov_10.990820:170-1498(-)
MAYFTGAVEAAMMVVLGGYLVCVGAHSGYALAKLCRELQVRQQATDQLLDHATDGFCQLDIASQAVMSASAKLHETLGVPDGLLGTRFGSLLKSHIDEQEIAGLYDAVATCGELKPALVTCIRPDGMECDAKVVPYSASVNQLNICVQMLGEWRPPLVDTHVKRCGQPLAALREGEDETEREFDWLHEDKGADHSDVDLESVAGTVHTERSNHTAQTLTSLAYSFASSALSLQSIASQTDVSWQICGATTKDTAMQTEKRCGQPPLLPRSGPAPTSGPPPARRRPHKIHLNSSAVALPRFAATPRRTLVLLLYDVAQHINACGMGCCFFHICMALLARQAHDMLAGACDGRLRPLHGWQCRGCRAMNLDTDDENDLFCDVCGDNEAADPRESDLSSAAADDERAPRSNDKAAVAPEARAQATSPATEAWEGGAGTATGEEPE